MTAWRGYPRRPAAVWPPRSRRLFGNAMCALLLAFVLSEAVAGPQPGQSPRRLLIMDSQVGEPYQSVRLTLLQTLAAAGFAEGDRLSVVYHSIGNDRVKGREILRDELARDYDVIFVNGTLMALAAKDIAWGGTAPPVVFACVTDPVGIGVIDGFDRPPPANFTGVSYPVPVQRRLEFLRTLLPQARRIGIIYADMPQSRSYRRWLESLVATHPRYQDLQLIFRSVPLITGEGGSQRMAEATEPLLKELDPRVDVFLSPNDQMGVRSGFAERVYRIASKPLIGLGREDVTEGWGAAASIYPSLRSAGRQAGEMIQRLFAGEPVADIQAQWTAETGFAFDLHKAQRLGLSIPAQWLKAAKGSIVH